MGFNGSTFTNFGSNTAPTSTSFVTKTLDFKLQQILLMELARFDLKITFSGITGATSNNRLIILS